MTWEQLRNSGWTFNVGQSFLRQREQAAREQFGRANAELQIKANEHDPEVLATAVDWRVPS